MGCTGGVYVVRSGAARFNYQVSVQLLNSAGVPQWTSPAGYNVSNNAQANDYPTIVPQPSGKLVVVWHNKTTKSYFIQQLQSAVSLAQSTTVLTSSTNPATAQHNLSLTATVTGGSGTATGTVDFSYSKLKPIFNGFAEAATVVGITKDAAGNIYTANNAYNTSASSPFVAEYPVGGGNPIITIIDGSLNSTYLSGIVVDPAGNIDVTDLFLYEVIKLPVGGGTQTVIPTGSYPQDIFIDNAGTYMYTADHFGNDLTKIPVGGCSTTTLVTGSQPYRIAEDSAGNIYAINSGANYISKFIGGSGSEQVIALSAGATTPQGLFIDMSDNIYTSNFGSIDVTKIPAGAGTPISIPIAGAVNLSEIVVDSQGNIFVGALGTGGNNVIDGGIYYIPSNLGAVSKVTFSRSEPSLLYIDSSDNLLFNDGYPTPDYIEEMPAFTAFTPTTSGNLNGSGVANLTVNNLTGGSYAILASYNGDGTYDSSASLIAKRVNFLDALNNLQSSSNPSLPAQNVDFTSTVSASGVTPTGGDQFLEVLPPGFTCPILNPSCDEYVSQKLIMPDTVLNPR